MTTAPPATPPVPPQPSGGTQVGRTLRGAWRAAAVAVERMPARIGYDVATDLVDVAGDLVELAAGLRARMAARVAREAPGGAAGGGLTVRELAVELGCAPSKAGEFLSRAAREETRPRPAPDPVGDGPQAGAD